jgi:glycosyltransferase involved in cell wall biosynthesis
MPNVTWHGRVAYDRALELSAASDVLFATYDPGIPNHRYSSANKVFEGMMLGKPIIVARGTNMDRMIENADCGIIVNYGNEPELEEALSLLACNPALRSQYGQNARRAYETVYRWENMQSRLKEMYREILQERSG